MSKKFIDEYFWIIIFIIVFGIGIAGSLIINLQADPLVDYGPNKINVIVPNAPITITAYFTDTTFSTALGSEKTEIVLEENTSVTIQNNTKNQTMYVFVEGTLTVSNLICSPSGGRQIISDPEQTWQQITVDPSCQITLQNNSEEPVSLTTQILTPSP